MAAALSNHFVSAGDLHIPSFPGHHLKPTKHYLVHFNHRNLSLGCQRKGMFATRKSQVVVRAAYSGDGGRPGNSTIFVGGFILGGIIVGTLGCVYAPQISKALAGADKKDLMRKLPKFIYDEEKAVERTRKILAQKIEQLNSAIDDVSSQLRTEDAPNGAAVQAELDEVEAAI